MIRGLKFRGFDYLAHELGTLAGRRFAADLGDIHGVVAVPMHWFRKLGRGYDQAELIGRSVAETLSLPFLEVVRRKRLGRPQSSMPRNARLMRLRGAFKVSAAAGIEGQRILVVDDVATTGATLTSVAEALLVGGAAEVVALVLARTPPKKLNLTASSSSGDTGRPHDRPSWWHIS